MKKINEKRRKRRKWKVTQTKTRKITEKIEKIQNQLQTKQNKTNKGIEHQISSVASQHPFSLSLSLSLPPHHFLPLRYQERRWRWRWWWWCSEQSHDLLRLQIKVNVVYARSCRQPGHGGHRANKWEEEAGPHRRPHIPHRQGEARRCALPAGVGC